METKNPNNYFIQTIPKKKKLPKNFIKNYLSLKTSNLLKISGDSKNYQKIILLKICYLNFFISFIYNSFAYLFYMPDFLCYNKKGELSKCTNKIACKNKFGYEIISQRISLVTKYNLFCENEFLYTNGIAYIFLISGISSFIFTFFTDFFGRSFILKFSSFFFLVGGFFILFDNYYFIIFGLGFLFCYDEIFISTIYIFTNESMNHFYRNLSLGLGFLSVGLGNFTFLFFNLFIDNYYYDLIILFLVTYSGIFFLFYFIETPFFFYQKKNVLYLYTTLKKIMKENYKKKHIKK